MAPEFIPALLGPAWAEVVLPFRLFTPSLLFRMSSKISDACTKAAGEVYSQALLQGAFGAMVVLGSLVGRHWGVGGVAVAVSIAGINWLSIAGLSRWATGLSWSRFGCAHAPAALLAGLIGVAAIITAEAARASHLGNVAVLVAAGLTATVVTFTALRLRSKLFLGPHGRCASQEAATELPPLRRSLNRQCQTAYVRRPPDGRR